MVERLDGVEEVTTVEEVQNICGFLTLVVIRSVFIVIPCY